MVIWTGAAKADLRHIFEYIAHDSHQYATKVIQELTDKTHVLNELPNIGKIVAEFNGDHVRELSLYSYRIIYEITGLNIYGKEGVNPNVIKLSDKPLNYFALL